MGYFVDRMGTSGHGLDGELYVHEPAIQTMKIRSYIHCLLLVIFSLCKCI